MYLVLGKRRLYNDSQEMCSVVPKALHTDYLSSNIQSLLKIPPSNWTVSGISSFLTPFFLWNGVFFSDKIHVKIIQITKIFGISIAIKVLHIRSAENFKAKTSNLTDFWGHLSVKIVNKRVKIRLNFVQTVRSQRKIPAEMQREECYDIFDQLNAKIELWSIFFQNLVFGTIFIQANTISK